MQLSRDETAELIEVMNQKGFKHFEAWLTLREKEVTDAIKLNLMSMKWEEAPKWNAYYSGQMAVLTGIKSFVKQNVETSYRKEKWKADKKSTNESATE